MTDEDRMSAQEVIHDLTKEEMDNIGATLIAMHPEMESIADELDDSQLADKSSVTYTLPFQDLYWLHLFAQAAYLREARRREYIEHGEGAEPQ